MLGSGVDVEGSQWWECGYVLKFYGDLDNFFLFFVFGFIWGGMVYR